MGNNLSTELAEGLFDISLEQQIAIQLRSNHYPPVPLTMVEPCIQAIVAYNDGESNKQIPLPEGVTWRGKESAPAHAIIEGHHLHAWCESL